jgi:hypothetical protein
MIKSKDLISVPRKLRAEEELLTFNGAGDIRSIF